MRKLKVLVCALHPRPSGYQGGGVFRFLHALRRADFHGLEYIVIENRPSLGEVYGLKYLGTQVSTRDVAYWAFDGSRSLGAVLMHLFLMCCAVGQSIVSGVTWVKKEGVDLVLSPWERAPTIFCAYAISKLTGRPWTANVLLTPACGERSGSSKSRLQFRCIYRYHRYTRGLPSVTSALFTGVHWFQWKLMRREIMIANGPTVRELKTIDPKMDVIEYFPGASVDIEGIDTVSFGERQYDAIFAGLIHPRKGVFDAIDAWDIITRKMSGKRLVIIGRGTMQTVALIQRRIKRLFSPSSVVLPFDLRKGAPNQTDLWWYMKRNKVFLYPSMMDAWPVVVLEALACGLPVVTYDTAAIRYAFGDCRAILCVPVRDVNALAEACASLLGRDDSKVSELRRQAREFAQKFDHDTTLEAEKRAYLETVRKWHRLRSSKPDEVSSNDGQ